MNRKNYKVEICVNSAESCAEAQKGGAHRVELCAALSEGGLTPSYGEVAGARNLLEDTKLHVIIRPRAGDFLFSDREHEIMLADIAVCKRLGVDGVVFGTLTAEGEIDMLRNKQLAEAAEGMSKTFHRAFDMCRNPFDSLEKIVSLGFDRILTSGQQPKAEQGIGLLKELVRRAGNRIVIMPGSGIDEGNIAKIARETGASEFHFSAKVFIESGMKYRNPAVSMGGAGITTDEYKKTVASAEKIKNTIKELEKTLRKAQKSSVTAQHLLVRRRNRMLRRSILLVRRRNRVLRRSILLVRRRNRVLRRSIMPVRRRNRM